MSALRVSIVTYKTDPETLIRCLECIVQSSIPTRVLVIDNSPDDSIRSVATRYGAGYVHRPDNPGYGAGHNVAIAMSIATGAAYHLVLNADVVFPPDTLGEILSYMDNNPNVAQVMPKILNPDGSIQRLCKLVPTPIDLFIRRFLPGAVALNARRRFELLDSGYDTNMFVPYLSGCFMFLRCNALREVGLFDERFFMYPEDIDLTRRLATRYDTRYFPQVAVMHEHGAASRKSLRMLMVHFVNMVRYFNKWGWFFDEDRRRLNKKTLDALKPRGN